jgi:omega-3 fatty acid desaturase (delta-15 desaturase)
MCASGLYWFALGTVMWGMFTVAHDCGHGGFSTSPTLNSVVGNVFHTLLMTPYESWRLSHRYHHDHTGDIDKDEIFFPQRAGSGMRHVKISPILMGVAWYLYLLVGHGPRNAYHFWANDPIFKVYRGEKRVAASLMVYMAWFTAVSWGTWRWGVWAAMEWYIMPLLVMGTWLTLTTFLHHNFPGGEWYSGEEWDFVRGNLTSVDRNFAPFNNIIHNIGTHQIHHLFPNIPHYNLVRATAAFRRAYPKLVHYDPTPVWVAFFRAYKAYISAPEVPQQAKHFKYPGQLPADEQ